MGEKGDKRTGEASLAVEELLDKLGDIDGLSSKKMFGGYGIFHTSGMFGIIDSSGQAYLKVGDGNRSAYEASGSGKHGKMPYYAIPDDVLKDADTLCEWAMKSIQLNES